MFVFTLMTRVSLDKDLNFLLPHECLYPKHILSSFLQHLFIKIFLHCINHPLSPQHLLTTHTSTPINFGELFLPIVFLQKP